ncbi:MAG: tRNA (guanosine(37)-N1)-methyltransferase TrmD [Sphingobacteriaceae bacterium]|nr:tRNA (guanosine(37)-N1)-methyltransferase TrmD [Sphingobacteriaceae bacterium]
MRIDILSAVPRLLDSFLQHSILKRAQDKGLAELVVHDLRDYSSNKYRQIDDQPYGGGAGMVMMIEPIHKCIEQLKSERDYAEVIYMSPDGKMLDQPLCNRLAVEGNLILLCGHYKGVDERVREHLCTMEISVGNYVLTGGELAAAIVADSVVRLLPGVLNDETSALSDSFQDGLVAPPVYTRPANYQGWEVPAILRSGHEANIERWRHEQAVERTRQRRPEMLGD